MPILRPAAAFVAASLLLLAAASAQDAAPDVPFEEAVERAEELEVLRTLLVAQDGETLVEEGFHGHSPDGAANIKSASKSVISALVGIAIDEGLLEGPDQKIAPLLSDRLPEDPDPRLNEITIGNLLSMQAGLERTSGGNYGAWISSANWVRDALRRPFVDEPGGRMLYSTGNTHLLSAILTKVSGRSTLALLNDWLGPAGVRVTSWERDPQGIYLGGNQMAMTPRSLLAFGELYRRGGVTAEGVRIVSEGWIRTSWQPRTRSAFGHGEYGYGWFISELGGYRAYSGWGYGGQMIYVVPDLELTVAITSSPNSPSARSGYKGELDRLVAETIVPVAEERLGDAG